MPSGGVVPGPAGVDYGTCWVCRKPGTQHFWHEFDTGIHARCVVSMLAHHEEMPDPEAELLTELTLDMKLEEQ